MDSGNNLYRFTNIFRLSILLLFTSAVIISAQDKSDQDKEYDLPQIAIDNYLVGAQSDNDGLKASCIYFLGKYKVLEANSLLIKEIGDTEDEDLKILIAWCLYRIGDDEGIKKLEQIAYSGESANLKSFCSNLYDIKTLENALSQVYVKSTLIKYYTD